MAKFLIKAIDANHSDPTKDARGCYKRGDIVAVMPDDHEWGSSECSPKFVKINIPDLDHINAKKYLENVNEIQTQTKKWDSFQWANAQNIGDYKDFISEPTVISTIDKEIIKTIQTNAWGKMQTLLDYSPFIDIPSFVPTSPTEGEITGTVRIITLEGQVNQCITRCKWKILFNNLPNEIKTQLQEIGEITVSWNNLKGCVENKPLGVTEA